MYYSGLDTWRARAYNLHTSIDRQLEIPTEVSHKGPFMPRHQTSRNKLFSAGGPSASRKNHIWIPLDGQRLAWNGFISWKKFLKIYIICQTRSRENGIVKQSFILCGKCGFISIWSSTSLNYCFGGQIFFLLLNYLVYNNKNNNISYKWWDDDVTHSRQKSWSICIKDGG